MKDKLAAKGELPELGPKIDWDQAIQGQRPGDDPVRSQREKRLGVFQHLSQVTRRILKPGCTRTDHHEHRDVDRLFHFGHQPNARRQSTELDPHIQLQAVRATGDCREGIADRRDANLKFEFR